MSQQLKKLLYNKSFVDAPEGGHIAEWKISPWKVFALFIVFLILAVFVYGWVFTEDRQNFFGNIVFYSIVLVLVIFGLWFAGKTAWSFKQRITYFLIAFILLWFLYWILAIAFDALGNPGGLDFHVGGSTLWVVLSLLAFIGAKRIDKHIDRNDMFFGLLVLAVFIGANIPMNDTGGFLVNVDNIINSIMSYLP